MLQITLSPSGKVTLHLPTGIRYIGTIERDCFRCWRDTSKNLFRATDSIGFNFELLRDGTFTRIEVTLSDGRILRTRRRFALAHSSFLHFKKKQFERQVFLKISDFGDTRAEQWERLQDEQLQREAKHQHSQLSLFAA